jgi:hypothetical protein
MGVDRGSKALLGELKKLSLSHDCGLAFTTSPWHVFCNILEH